MKFTVEAWAPEYGTSRPFEEPDASAHPPAVDVELPARRWAPMSPRAGTPLPQRILFVDGVRRVDATVWIEADEGPARLGICASYAAGAVLCDGRARLVDYAVRRGLFTAAPGARSIVTRAGEYPKRAVAATDVGQLSLALQQHMAELEGEVAAANSDDAGVIVVDGPLTGRRGIRGAVGYIKTHHVDYLGPALAPVVGQLEPGQRTPLFLTTTSWSRYSWYLRLPGGRSPGWGGVVRCEAPAELDVDEIRTLADTLALGLPRFASAEHKDPRAPQNLYPIGALEHALRRRLGDASLLYRALREAGAVTGN